MQWASQPILSLLTGTDNISSVRKCILNQRIHLNENRDTEFYLKLMLLNWLWCFLLITDPCKGCCCKSIFVSMFVSNVICHSNSKNRNTCNTCKLLINSLATWVKTSSEPTLILMGQCVVVLLSVGPYDTFWKNIIVFLGMKGPSVKASVIKGRAKAHYFVQELGILLIYNL